MNTIRDERRARRGRAGCPPVLEIDLVGNDVQEPPVEWPPAPPTRGDQLDVTDVTRLTTGRVVRLLDASVDHLRTALETNGREESGVRIERAIADIARARETLADLDEA